MNIYKDFIKTTKAHEYLLSVILIIYIIFDIHTPHYLLSTINNGIFQFILIVIVIILIFYINPIISILAIIAVFVLFNRSKNNMNQLIPNEETKFIDMLKYNNMDPNNVDSVKLTEHKIDQADDTLEESIVSQMAPPIINSNEKFSFQSLVNKTHNADLIN